MDEFNKLMEQSIEHITEDVDKVDEVDSNASEEEQPFSRGCSVSPPIPICGNLDYLDLSNEATVLEIVNGAVSKALLYPKVGFLDDDSRSLESNALCIDESASSETEDSPNCSPVNQQTQPNTTEEADDQFLLDLIDRDAQKLLHDTEVDAQNQVSSMDSTLIGPMPPPIDLMHNGTICPNVQGPIPEFLDFNEWTLPCEENTQGSKNVDVSICFSYSNFDDSSKNKAMDDQERRRRRLIYELTQDPNTSEPNPNPTPSTSIATTRITYNFVCAQGSSNKQNASTLKACAIINNNILSKYNYPYERLRLSSRNLEIVDGIISKYIKDCFGEQEDLFRESRCIQYGPSRNFINISMYVNPRRLHMRNSGEPISFYHFESNTVVLQFPFPNHHNDTERPKKAIKKIRRYHATFPKNLNMQIEKRHEVARKLVASIFEMEKKDAFGENRNSGRGERRMSRMLGQPINLRFSLATGEISENTNIPFEANHCIEEVFEEGFEDSIEEIGLDITFKDIDDEIEENIAVPSTSGVSNLRQSAHFVTPMDEEAKLNMDVAADDGDEKYDDAATSDDE
ncbi:PREDICTED: uncharacterized protein LOC108564854, partial [Nicrophorus vespilloides]|uniref:Uncharacterized protein LOC108564854 n=1 Tax=Nicrophorus vespilloides TaxID=110193 RepID=A0ABM1MY63_NICVS